MAFSKPPGVPCPPNNPHCQGLEPPGASIENWIIVAVIVIAICVVVLIKIYKHENIRVQNI